LPIIPLTSFKDEADIQFVRKDGNEIVSTAKVEKLIQLLFDTFYNETNFSDIFLLTHKYFIPSLDLLKIIEKEYPLYVTLLLQIP
jgi:hypothetical protein